MYETIAEARIMKRYVLDVKSLGVPLQEIFQYFHVAVT